MIKGKREMPAQKKVLIQAELKKIAAATADNIPKAGAAEQKITLDATAADLPRTFSTSSPPNTPKYN